MKPYLFAITCIMFSFTQNTEVYKSFYLIPAIVVVFVDVLFEWLKFLSLNERERLSKYLPKEGR